MNKMRPHLFILIASAILIGLSACGLAACGLAAPAATAAPATAPAATPSPRPTPAAASTLQPVNALRKLTVNGLERSYLVHIPTGLNGGASIPLVFVFHGYAENADYIQQASGFNDIADTGRFIVVYPTGSGSEGSFSWNAGACCDTATSNHIDEAAFVHQIIADLGTLARIDPKRTYAAGFSNGALLSYRLACEMSDTFAAVAPVAGALVTDPCQPGQPVSVIHFHGLVDAIVPYAGGTGAHATGETYPPTEQSVAAFAKLDGCSATPKVEQAAAYTHTAYAGCKNGAAVELYAVKGVGHMWPTKYIVPASQIIWDFFAAHPKR
jgi:polyhydroxybutyrate depolymerase